MAVEQDVRVRIPGSSRKAGAAIMSREAAMKANMPGDPEQRQQCLDGIRCRLANN